MNSLIKILPLAAMISLAACATKSPEPESPALKDAFEGKFLLGAALNLDQITGKDSLGAEVARRHFNSIVAENVMKCEEIHPERDRYDWTAADAFVKFGEENGQHMVGHCLIWHSQCAPWFFVDENGDQVSADTLKQRMRDHIHAVVGRYKGKIKGWDVVNESIVEDGSYRKSKFYEILGDEFIPLAFEYAHEADPDAELYLNDYGMNVAGRRDAYVRLARSLKERGLRIDAIGMQGHMGMDYPDLSEFEASIDSFASTGCKVMITELDVSALPSPHWGANISDTEAYRKEMNPYPEVLPDSATQAWSARMDSLFTLFDKHSNDITRVTVWGISDKGSWKNDFPMHGRTDYPLLFDRDYKMKPFLEKYLTSSASK